MSIGLSMRSIDSSFYKSRAWKNCRAEYIRQNPLCEMCLKEGRYTPASHIHHKVWLNADNYLDASVALNFDNLESLCQECHNKIHSGHTGRRYTVDQMGRVIL